MAEPEPSQPASPPELRPLGAFLLVAICYAGVMTVMIIGADFTDGGTKLLLVTAGIVGPLIAMYVGLNRYTPTLRTSEALGLGRPRGRQLVLIPIAIGVGVALAPILFELTQSITERFPFPETVDVEAPDPPEAAGQAVYLVMILFASPLVVEAFFRGLLLGRLQVSVGRLRALVVVTLLYTVVHAQPRFMPEAFLLAGVMGALALFARSTWTAVAGHVAAAAAHALLPRAPAPAVLAVCAATVVTGLVASWRIGERSRPPAS